MATIVSEEFQQIKTRFYYEQTVHELWNTINMVLVKLGRIIMTPNALHYHQF
jgi:hypothetical protein